MSGSGSASSAWAPLRIGVVADAAGLVPAFLISAAVMAAGAATLWFWPFHNIAGMDRSLVRWPEPQLLISGRGASLINVIPTTSPEAKATSTLISQLRDSVIPAAEHGTTLRVYVGGVTAINGDFATIIAPKLLVFIGVILILGFLLLMLAFRSLLIPAVAAVMNLLAAAASFGVLVAIFQYGWGLRLLNLGQPGPIESFLPVLMLAVLFGLSMDYEVFLVSRIREEWAATGDNHQAVRTGQATTGRVIIAAATIMILVFSAFILTGQQTIGEIGIGLAAAVLLDAFLLRTLLVPALMHLSGRGNWWLPGWLDPSSRTCPSNPPPDRPPCPPPRPEANSPAARQPASQERHRDHLIEHIHPHAGPAHRRVARPLRPPCCPRSRRAGPLPAGCINGGEDGRAPAERGRRAVRGTVRLRAAAIGRTGRRKRGRGDQPRRAPVRPLLSLVVLTARQPRTWREGTS